VIWVDKRKYETFFFIGVFFRIGMNIIIITSSIQLRVFFFLEILVMYTTKTKS